MAGAKGRSGGARSGSGRKPSEKTLFAQNFIGPLPAKPRKPYELKESEIRKCKVCGGSFVKKQYHNVYCSDKCRIRSSNTSQRKKEKLSLKYKTDPMYNMVLRVRARTAKAFCNIGWKKSKRTEEMLGCTFEQLKDHIGRQFVRGMSWDNRSKWHIDHIIPLAEAKTCEDIISLSHFTNMRPIWARENLSKGAKVLTLI